MTEYIELTPLERLIIWIRITNMNSSEIGESLGIAHMSVGRSVVSC